jgi:hypothetical protein
MTKQTEIDVDTWNDAIGGKSNNPMGDDEIKRMANDGELVVVDHDGKRFDPIVSDDGSWALAPNTTLEITYKEWVSDASAGMRGTPRYEQLHQAAENQKLVIIDTEGARMIPVRFGESWRLERETE